MNRYPLWKSLLFAGVMVLALLLALPNVFGEAPALQLSRKDGELFITSRQDGMIRMLVPDSGTGRAASAK